MSTERDPEVTSQRERMPDRAFDELATGLASGAISRRRVLRLMGSAIVGTVLASVSGVAWAVPPEGRGRPCPKGEKKCGDTCCSSPEDLCCRGVCTNVVFDRFNCGRCGNECATGEGCCGGRCVPLNTRDNCGCCGCGCLEAEICVNGSCQCPEPGQTVCANVCCPQGHCVFGGPGEPDRCVP
jgi:Stigma-specific protein, Stig1